AFTPLADHAALPRSAPKWEQSPSNIASRPLAVQYATRRRPSILRETGPRRGLAEVPNRYHDAGKAGKTLLEGLGAPSDVFLASRSPQSRPKRRVQPSGRDQPMDTYYAL